MLDLSHCKLVSFVIHYIGSALETNSLVLMENTIEEIDIATENAFKQLAFNRFNENEKCEFYHESQIELNEVYSFSKGIFRDRNTFIENSKNIAKHLNAVSRHPNIKGGELFIALFEGCKYNEESTNILAIVKIEDKEEFLDIHSEKKGFSVKSIYGINPKQMNKVCLIFDFENNEPHRVFINTRKKDELVYWKDDFLKIQPQENDFFKTNILLQECRSFILKKSNFTPNEKVEYLTKSLDYFKNEKEFKASKYISKTFNKKVENVSQLEDNLRNYETVISDEAIHKMEKKYSKSIKLDSDVQIKINVKNIEDLSTVIEKGFDSDRKMNYYKIYFAEER
ncbi:hypothetical protein C4A75_14440 [Brevibacillus laterosporus]|uniref:hypothetical protein n=1 Tax=Brevibacillus laterosporus TaxID=1465 RepID=UPI000CE34209|nr:hypothetical protein [Brevibacillus laterosporus]PPA83913.1 hypothetical protein C4A75_14440 [Brevibacillus laterosporus]